MKRILFLLVCVCFIGTIQAQDMKSLFVELPDSLSPLWTKVNREDFGDFLASDMKAEVRNRFGKTSEMLKLTDDYLLLKASSTSTIEMKLFPVNDSVRVICVVHTYSAPVADSHVSFYSTEWKELPVKDFLELPSEDDFYQPCSGERSDSLANMRLHADMYLSKAVLSEKDNDLSFFYTTLDYLDKESAEKVKPYLVGHPLRYVWKDGRFFKIENDFPF